MWDWGETEYVRVAYKSKKTKGEAQKFIDITDESDFLDMLEQFTDGTEIEIFVTISSDGIPFNFNVQDVVEDVVEGEIEVEDDVRIENVAEEEDDVRNENVAVEEDNVGDEDADYNGIEDAVGDEGVVEEEYGVEEDEGGAHLQADYDAVDEGVGDEGVALKEAYGVEDEGGTHLEADYDAVDEGVGYEGVAEGVEGVDESDKSSTENFEQNLGFSSTETDSDEDELVYDNENPIVDYGVKYPDVNSFRSALHQFAVQNQFQFKIIKSDQSRVTARCTTEGCGWRIHAARIRGEATFQIKTLQSEHTCEVVNRCGNKNATKGWIAERIINWLKNEGDIPVSDLSRRLKEQYGRLELPYLRVWKGKELAMTQLHGKWDLSFLRVFDFCDEIRRRNVGSHTQIKLIELEGKQHFQRMFIAFGASIQGFLRGCRPYVGLDGAHLKGKFKGIIVSAIALDGNNSMFPVAYGVVESENAESWEWFLVALKEAIGCPNGLVLSSDRQKGLDKALLAVYPTAEHRECMRHLYSNFKKRFRGDILKKHLWGAARAYTSSAFQYHMERVQMADSRVVDYLRENHGHVWSRSLFGIDAKCEQETNNISETFNSWISKERNRPVIDMMDAIRQKIMIMMNKRRRDAAKWSTKLVPGATKHINNLTKDLGNYKVLRCSDEQAEIEGPNARCDVS
ncbi:uncharacterized protein LOC109726337 [Ananas comosus]|uniref:Uncharacterized protein LOC109726337 n=1 Tax=Ananas comosus TaxID=4615 RepID=A0A6P5H0M0_ANACO|nr:uncharacterized protein LOC109726337 [Ananas comosus]